MAQHDRLAARVEGDWNTLYWWRRRAPARDHRGSADPAAPIATRLEAFAAQRRVQTPKLASSVAAPSASAPAAAPLAQLDPVLADALRQERRSAGLTFAFSFIATLAPAATLIYAIVSGLAIAAALAGMGVIVAGYGCFFAARRVLVIGLQPRWRPR